MSTLLVHRFDLSDRLRFIMGILYYSQWINSLLNIWLFSHTWNLHQSFANIAANLQRPSHITIGYKDNWDLGLFIERIIGHDRGRKKKHKNQTIRGCRTINRSCLRKNIKKHQTIRDYRKNDVWLIRPTGTIYRRFTNLILSYIFRVGSISNWCRSKGRCSLAEPFVQCFFLLSSNKTLKKYAFITINRRAFTELTWKENGDLSNEID